MFLPLRAAQGPTRQTADVSTWTIGARNSLIRSDEMRNYVEGYFLYNVGRGPFSSVSRSQIMPSRV